MAADDAPPSNDGDDDDDDNIIIVATTDSSSDDTDSSSDETASSLSTTSSSESATASDQDDPDAPNEGDKEPKEEAVMQAAVSALHRDMNRMHLQTVPYVESLVNLTSTPIRVRVRGDDAADGSTTIARKRDEVALLELCDPPRLPIHRTLPCQEPNADGERRVVNVLGMPRTDELRVRALAELKRDRCTGVVVPMAVALFLQRLTDAQLEQVVPLALATTENELQVRRVPVYTTLSVPNAHPEERVLVLCNVKV